MAWPSEGLHAVCWGLKCHMLFNFQVVHVCLKFYAQLCVKSIKSKIPLKGGKSEGETSSYCCWDQRYITALCPEWCVAWV